MGFGQSNEMLKTMSVRTVTGQDDDSVNWKGDSQHGDKTVHVV